LLSSLLLDPINGHKYLCQGCRASIKDKHKPREQAGEEGEEEEDKGDMTARVRNFP
jgi:hypothetical protein